MTDVLAHPSGPMPLVDGPIPQTDGVVSARRAPAAAVASRLIETLESAGDRDVVLVASGERRADEIARAVQAMLGRGDGRVQVFPPWDCLPYDRAPPSRESMGRRMAVLADLAMGGGGRLIVTSPEAVMQRTAPSSAARARFEVAVGDPLDREALEAFALRTGYIPDERIDEPGEMAMLGEVIDLYPASAPAPYRLVLSQDGAVVDEIKAFDPVTQRSHEAVDRLTLTAASEWVRPEGDVQADEGADPAEVHRLADLYDSPLGHLLEAASDAVILTEEGVSERIGRVADQIAEAYEARRTFDTDGTRPPAPERLYLSAAEMQAALDPATPLNTDGLDGAPAFATERSPGGAMRDYVEAQRGEGRTVVIAGLAHEHRAMARLLKRNGIEAPAPVDDWAGVLGARPGSLVKLVADLDRGYEDQAENRVVLTPTDITGGRVARATDTSSHPFGETEIRIGDVVIHEDHGLGVLRAIEEIETDGVRRDVLRLEYHGGASLLAPVEDLGRIWRYGSEPSAVTLDRLNTQGWLKRRAEVSAQIDATAARMVEMARVRQAARTPAVTPPKAAYARFAARFPFPESVDQASAIEAVLEDLSAGVPMNRLVCGDVGFGKTEVALRAAAAVALSGRQVLVAAPTTVLARQHYESFRRRFEGTGVEVAHLSRLVDAAETTAVRAGLADGTIHIVVGTHALASEALEFQDAALVIIDEEHRFGAKLKAALAARAPHVLAMSATPIPRTLQGAMVGIQDVSIIASPPARRRPIRTFLTDFDEASVRTVLMREKARGGQSFLVVPRIEDLEPLGERLKTLVPELKPVTAHGKMAPDEMDAVMTGFADGRGDVLLATNIIENGLDVPRANTMLIWRPDRFGLAQLHQLRGRVGRGRRQGFVYLLSDPAVEIAENTRARLQTLEALDRLGAGFAISARDLDLRGGGDLVGEEQAGHVRLIGASLYQRVLSRALRAARGETGLEPIRPALTLPTGGRLPTDYVPDPTVRINLYARLSHLTTAEAIDALQEEMEDRFGPLPDPALALMAAARLTALALAAGVSKVVSGPKATAFSFGGHRAGVLADRLKPAPDRRWAEDRLIIQANDDHPHDQDFMESVLEELAAA